MPSLTGNVVPRSRRLTSRSTGLLAGGAGAPSARSRLAWFVRRHSDSPPYARRLVTFPSVADHRSSQFSAHASLIVVGAIAGCGRHLATLACSTHDLGSRSWRSRVSG